MALPPDEQQGQRAERATAERPVRRSPPVPTQRNRLLAFALASVAVLVLITAVTLVIMVHYAEVHDHMLVSF